MSQVWQADVMCFHYFCDISAEDVWPEETSGHEETSVGHKLRSSGIVKCFIH